MPKATEQPPSTVGQGTCGAKTRSGGTCGKPAGWGTPTTTGRCKLHGGATPSHVKAAQKLQASSAVATYGLPRDVDPHVALLEELHRTAGHVAWLGGLIQVGVLPAAENPTGKQRAIKLTQNTLAGDIPSVWLSLYQQERKHLADVAKTCIAVGIEERRVRVAEQAGEQMAALIRSVLSDLGVPLDDPRTREVVTRNLRVIDGGLAA